MKILQALLFVCMSFSVFSQKNYVDGFIILKDQTDTLKGKIDDQNWVVNPTTINFKNAGSIEESYDISHLKAFGIFEKESYLVEKSDLDVTPFEYNALLDDRNLIVKKDTLLAFLVLLKADYNLLYLKDAQNKEHFFYTENKKITELINHKFLQKRDGKMYEFHNKLYQKQLELLFNQCDKKISVNNINYDIQTLTDKFIEFSECIGCTYTCYVKKKTDKAIFTIGVMAGVSSERNFFSHFEAGVLYFETKTKPPGMLIGLSASLSSKRKLNRDSYVLEAYINRESVENAQNNYSRGIYYVNFVPRLRHQLLSKNRTKPFASIGLNAKYLISYPGQTAISGNRLTMFFVGEAGLKYNNFLISANVNISLYSENFLIRYYEDIFWTEDSIQQQKISFQLNLTYLLFNSANKKR